MRSIRTIVAAALTALLALAVTGPAANAAPTEELFGNLARVEARIMFETVIGCEQGDTTCTCTHLGTAQATVRTLDGSRIQAGRMPVAVLGPCDLGDRIRVRGEVASLLQQRVNRNGKTTGAARLLAAAGEVQVAGTGTPILINLGQTPSAWEPGTDAAITFSHQPSTDVRKDITIEYAPGRDGWLGLRDDNGYLIITVTVVDGFVAFGAETTV